MSVDGKDEKDAIARYVALDAADAGDDGAGSLAGALAETFDRKPRASAAPGTPADDSDVFARCDAAMAIAPGLARSTALAWAFAEARAIARSAPALPLLPWYRRVGIAWSAAALSAAAAAVLAVLMLMPAIETAAPTMPGVASAAPDPALTLSPAEIANRIALFESVVLLNGGVAVDGRSVVVLPFVNEPGSPKLDAALGATPARALSDRLVRRLATMPGIYVIDPATAAIYADGALPPEQIALYLGVRGVVQGELAADGDTVRIDFRFIDAAGAGREIDREFERPIGEFAMLPNDMALGVLDALSEPPPPLDM